MHRGGGVTIEKSKKGMVVKIPNACKEMDVPVISPFAMLAAEKVKFHFNP